MLSWIVIVSGQCFVTLPGCTSAVSQANSKSTNADSIAIVGVNAPPAKNENAFGPLEVGADYASYRKLTTEPFKSTAHGSKWVDVYVSNNAADAYLSQSAEIAVGTVAVKTSWEDKDGRVSAVAGPIFVMEKRAPGYDPTHNDWYYAIHWANPTPEIAAKTKGGFYWRGKSKAIAYCSECHDDYHRSLGGLTPSSLLQR
jgi:Cytochrome P460